MIKPSLSDALRPAVVSRKVHSWTYPTLVSGLSISFRCDAEQSEIRLPWRAADAANSVPGCYLRVDCRFQAAPLQSRFLGSRCTRRACILSANGRRERVGLSARMYVAVAIVDSALLNSAVRFTLQSTSTAWRAPLHLLTFLIIGTSARGRSRRWCAH
jgi:hypothetical protein